MVSKAETDNDTNKFGTLPPKNTRKRTATNTAALFNGDNPYNNPYTPGKNRHEMTNYDKLRFAEMGSALYARQLTTEERTALRGYLSNSWFKKYSTALRTGDTETVSLYAAKVETIREVIKKYAYGKPITTFRAERFGNRKALADRIAQFEVGSRITPGGLFSTTADAKYVGKKAQTYRNSLAFEIESSTGLNLCSDWSPHRKTLHPFPAEMEVLLDGNQEFEVLSITEETWRGVKVTTIKLREVVPKNANHGQGNLNKR